MLAIPSWACPGFASAELERYRFTLKLAVYDRTARNGTSHCLDFQVSGHDYQRISDSDNRLSRLSPAPTSYRRNALQ